MGAWLSLPDPHGPLDDLLRQAERKQNIREHDIAQGIENRCQAVVAHGNTDAFIESLDYYTTVRVKCAFQLMNADGLRQRLAEVQGCMKALRVCLSGANRELETGFEKPEDALALDEAARDNPNALCVPTLEDFDLPPSPCSTDQRKE